MGARSPLTAGVLPRVLPRVFAPWAAALALGAVCAAACVVAVRGLMALEMFNSLMGRATWESASYLEREPRLPAPPPPRGGK